MPMLCVTDAHDKEKFYIEKSLIVMIRRASDNPLGCILTSSMMNQKGTITFWVLESPEEVSGQIRMLEAGADLLQKPS